ncbi:hypothetical protein Tco_0721015 [Tanacetum coccineum]
MPPRMRTQSVGRPVAESRGGGTGERVGIVWEGIGGPGGRRTLGIVRNGNWVGFLENESVQDMMAENLPRKVKYTASSFVVRIELVITMDGAGQAAVYDSFMSRLVVPKNVNSLNVRNPTPARGACYECGSTDHLKLACPRLNRAQGPGGNHPNQVVANNRGQGRGNQGNQARGRAFMLGAEEARQDLNIVTIVRIPLLDGKVLRVLGERPKEKARLLMSVKASDKEQEEIVVVRDFPEVFPNCGN